MRIQLFVIFPADAGGTGRQKEHALPVIKKRFWAHTGWAGLLMAVIFGLSSCSDDYPEPQASPPAIKPAPSGVKLTPKAVLTSANATGAASAVDGSGDTVWNSGSLPPHWIQLEFEEPTSVSAVLLYTEQTPAGATTHEVFGGPSQEDLKLLGTIEGNTQGLQWLELKVTANNLRYLKVKTVKSPAWVAWREIEVYK